jgi:hypothetical protein
MISKAAADSGATQRVIVSRNFNMLSGANNAAIAIQGRDQTLLSSQNEAVAQATKPVVANTIAWAFAARRRCAGRRIFFF